MLKPQIILNIAQVIPTLLALLVQKYKYWHVWRRTICCSTTSTGAQLTCFASTNVQIPTLTRCCRCAAVSPTAFYFCIYEDIPAAADQHWGTGTQFTCFTSTKVQIPPTTRMFPQQQTNTEDLVGVSLLALLVQKYKYWHLRSCVASGRHRVHSLLALLVQKHKYWHLRSCAPGRRHRVASLLALLVQKYKCWHLRSCANQVGGIENHFQMKKVIHLISTNFLFQGIVDDLELIRSTALHTLVA
jgi:hypothetical protein